MPKPKVEQAQPEVPTQAGTYTIDAAQMDSLLQEIYVCNWRMVSVIANDMREELQK